MAPVASPLAMIAPIAVAFPIADTHLGSSCDESSESEEVESAISGEQMMDLDIDNESQQTDDMDEDNINYDDHTNYDDHRNYDDYRAGDHRGGNALSAHLVLSE